MRLACEVQQARPDCLPIWAKVSGEGVTPVIDQLKPVRARRLAYPTSPRPSAVAPRRANVHE